MVVGLVITLKYSQEYASLLLEVKLRSDECFIFKEICP